MGAIVQYYNLIGGLNTIAGLGTINQSPRKTESPDMQNVEFYKMGGLQSMEGNIQFGNNTLTAPVALGHEYIYNDRKYLLVVTTDGEIWEYDRVSNEFVNFNKLYNFSSEASTGRKLFQIPTPRYSAVNFNNGVVLTNGAEDLIFYQKNRHILLTGEVSGLEGSNQITGNLTKFKTELHKGDTVAFGYDSTEYYIVEEILSDTEFLVSVPLKAAIPTTSMYIGPISFCNASMVDTTNVPEEEIRDLIGTPIRGLALQSYQGRLWVGGTDGVLYYSEVGLYNGWDIKYGAGNFPTFYNDTSAFTALALWDKVLVVCKRERTYLLDGTDPDEGKWKIEPYSINTVESQQSWIDCNNGLWGFSKRENGIYPILQRTIYNAFFGGNDLSKRIVDTFDYINQAKYDEIFPVYHPKKGYIMFYIPLLTGIGSNNCFCYDTKAKAWLLRKVPQEVTSAFEFDNEVYIGTKEGKVLKEFTGLTFDGQPIEFYWKSPWFYFSDATDNKTTKEFRVKISEEFTNKFKVRNRRDGRDVFKSRNVTNNLGAFTGLVWDIDYQEGDLNPEYSTKRQVIQVTDGKDNYYTPYTKEVETSDTVPLNTALFSDELCKELVTFVGLPYEYGRVYDISKADKLDPVETTIYRFSYIVPEYKRYTNGTDYIWISNGYKEPIANIPAKVSKSKSDVQLGYLYNRVGSWLDSNGEIDASKGPTNIVGPSGILLNEDKRIPSQLNYSDTREQFNLEVGQDVYMARDKYGRLFDGSPEVNYQTIYINKKGAFSDNNWSPDYNPAICWQFWKGLFRTTWTSGSSEYYGTTGEDTYSDLSKAGDTNILRVTKQTNGSFDIETTSGKFTDMVYDDTVGTQSAYLYSAKEVGLQNDPLFSNSELTLSIGKWDYETEGYNAITNEGDSINITNPEAMKTTTYIMYGKAPLTFIKVGNPIEVTNYWRYQIKPNYTDNTITDTKWDEDSWVISRQLTKRFPIPDQYFETMQIEFYGNGIDEGMAIYGFEIDGVELEEVPFK